MKKVGLTPLVIAIAWALVLGFHASATNARPQINIQFKKKYVQPTNGEAAVKKLADAVTSAKCNVCHVGTKKTDRNRYGQELAKLLKKNTKDAKKIQEALEKVEKMKLDEKDSSSPTYGDLMKQGNLPGGEE